MSYIIVDNREPQDKTFEIDCSLESYNVNIFRSISFILMQCNVYQALPNIRGFVVPLSTDRARLISSTASSESIDIMGMLRERVIARSNNDSTKNYLCDALLKISVHSKSFLNKKDSVLNILILTNDINLFGSEARESNNMKYRNSVKELITNTSSLYDANISIKLLCLSVLTLSAAQDLDIKGKMDIFDDLMKGEKYIKFKSVHNGEIFVEAEIKLWLYEIVQPIETVIIFPASKARRASLHCALTIATSSSLHSIHDGMRELSLVGTLPRDGVDPLCLEGGGFSLWPSTNILSDEKYVMTSTILLCFHSYIFARALDVGKISYYSTDS